MKKGQAIFNYGFFPLIECKWQRNLNLPSDAELRQTNSKPSLFACIRNVFNRSL